ncbi:Rrf2 family transcriptional regulator [Hoeflea sp.]|uniref:Rrf2 family transcriptional regulator n=1 Tax=Hoeflea sp. TaxID=1940281 RepID=UPI003A931EB9
MRLTSFTDFGLRALMRIASAPEKAFSSAELADEFGLSRNHLAKILSALAQAGIVTTRRGTGGGATLARPPSDIKLGDVVRVLEFGQPLVECFAASGGDCTISGCCRLKTRLRSAETAFLADLDRSTLADVALPSRAADEPLSGTDRLSPARNVA